MNISAAFSQKTPHPTGQYRGNFGHNRQRYFFRRFTAGVEPGWREQIVQGAMKSTTAYSLSCARISA